MASLGRSPAEITCPRMASYDIVVHVGDSVGYLDALPFQSRRRAFHRWFTIPFLTSQVRLRPPFPVIYHPKGLFLVGETSRVHPC